MAKINLNVEGAFIGDTPKINLNVEGAFIGDSLEKKNPSQKGTGLSGKSPFMDTKKDEDGFWGGLSDTFDIGLQRMASSAISGGATFLTKVLTGAIKGAVGEEDIRGQKAIKPLIDTLEAPSDWLLQKANEFNERSAPKLNEAAVKMGLKEENVDVPVNELLRKDVGQGFLKLGIASVTQIPQLVSTVLAGESKTNQFLASASLATTQSIQEEYDKDKNVSGIDIAQSGLKGIVEGLTEMIFDTDLKTLRKTGAAIVDVTYDGATSAIKELIKSQGKKEAKEAIVRTWGGVVKEGLKGMGQEALEEGISSAAGFVIDTVDSGKLDAKDYEKAKDDFFDSMLIGGFMGGGISSIGAIASKQKLSKEQEHQVSKLQEVANDESLPTEAREVAASKIEDIKKYNFGLANDNYKLLANLPVDQRVEALNLTNRIENFELAKSRAKTEDLIADFDLRIEDLEKKRDAIFNEYDASGAKAAAEAKKTQSEKDQEIANQFIDTNNIFGEIDNSLAPIQDRLNNNEQIDENELNKSADDLYTIADRIHKDETLTPEQKNIILAPIEEQIQKLDSYELATKTTTTEITQTATTKGTREVGRVERQGGAKDVSNRRWSGTPVSVTSADGTVTNTVAEVTPTGKIILKPKTSFNKKAQIREAQAEVAKKPLVIDTNYTEFVESKFDEDGNVSGVVLKDSRDNTTFEVNDPVLALDIAIKEKQDKLGAVTDAVFEQVLSETPVGTKILQETKLAGRKAAPAPQFTTQVQVAPTPNILGNLTPRQAVEIDDKTEQRTDNPILNTLGAQVKNVVSNAFKALKSVSPDSKMVIYDSEDSMIEGLVNEGVSREDAINAALGAGGLYNPSTGNVHINKGAKDASGNIVNTLTGTTIPHEVTHAVLAKLAKENPAEFTEMINRILPFIPEPQRSKLQEFAGRYEEEGGDIQAEEFLAELSAMITKGTVKFKTGHIHRIKLAIRDFIKKIADKYKSKSLAKFADNLFKNETSAQSDMKFFEDLARSIQSGQKINVSRLDELAGKGKESEEVVGFRQQKISAVKDINVKEIRTLARAGSRVSKGLSVSTKDGRKVVQEAQDLSLEYVRDNAPDLFIANSNIIAKLPLVKGIIKKDNITTIEDAQEIYDVFSREVANNLEYLMDNFNDKYKEVSTLWYDGANILAQDLSKKYGISKEQVAGIIASLSPQKDWYQNVRLAEMVLMSHAENPVMSKAMVDKQKLIVKEGLKPSKKSLDKATKEYKNSRTKVNKEALDLAKKKYEQNVLNSNKVIASLSELIGKNMNDVPNEMKGFYTRLWNEINTTKDYDVLRPDGQVMGVALKKNGKKAMVAWGSYTEINKANAIYLDGSQENITRSLGEMHKIRNFYNNIIDPMSKDQDVTMDTHAIAAALLMPLSGNSKQVGENFGTGTKNSSPLGIKGLYYAYAEGYKLAAKENNLLPRQVQSITWEAVRGLFEATFKNSKQNVAAIDKIWNEYSNNNISIDEARKQINDFAGGIKDPTWARPVQEGDGENVGQENVGGGISGTGQGAVGQPSGGLKQQKTNKLAPNGKPSNLTEGQYNQVRTPEFKAWFGDWENDPENASKVVDENGEPMVMYHGTSKDKDFDSFKISDRGAWFSSSPEEASSYASSNDSQKMKYDFESRKFITTNTSSRVIPVFLNIRNLVNQEDIDKNIQEEYRKMGNKSYRNAQKYLFSQIKYKNRDAEAFAYDRKQAGAAYNYAQVIVLFDGKTVQDGQYYRFISNQPNIKSAIGNIGQFSPLKINILQQKVPNATAASKKAFEQKRKFDISKFPRDLQKWLLDRQVNIRKALKDAEMEFTMYALVNKAGATPLANYKFQGIYKAIYDGMTKEEINRLDDFIFLRRVIAIDSNFDNQRDQLNKKIRDLVELKKIAKTKEELSSLDKEIKALHEKVKEKKRPQHPEHLDSNGNSVSTNKESAEQTLNSYKQSLGEDTYNKMYDKSKQYFDAFSDLLKYKFDNGLITKEEYDMYKDYNYSPRKFFNHVFGNTDANIYTTRGVSLTQDEIKGIQDGSLDYLETNSMKLLHSAMVATENKVMTNKALKTFFQEAAGKNLPFFKELNYERRKDGSIVTKPDGSLAYKGASAGFTNMIFKVDGINQGFQLDTELAKEFLDVEKWNANHKAYKLLANASGAQVLRQMATGLNVGFFISNIPIDLLSQVHFNDIYNGGGVGVAGQYQKAITGTLSTVKSLIANDPEIQKLVLEYAQAGGLMMTQSQEGTSQSAVLGKVENALSYLGNMSEMASKLNAYKSVKEREIAKYAEENNGEVPNAIEQEKINARAAFEARGAMDFHRGGLLTKYLDGFVPYLNVAFQGVRITADYIAKNPVKFTNKIIQTGLGVMALTLYNMMVAGDEWDNDDLQQAKAGKLLIFSPLKNADGTHSYTEIPVPTGVKAFWNLFQNMGEGIYYKHIVNKPEKLNGALAKTLADDLAMMLPKTTTMMPPTLKAIYEYSNNKNLWTNRNITYEVVKTKDEGKFDEKVLGIYKIMGKVMDAMGVDLSPIRTQKAVEDVITNPHTDIAIGLAYSMLDKFVNLIPEKLGGLSEKEKSKYSKQTIGDFAVQPIADLLSRATGTTDKKNNGKYLNIQEIIDNENKEVGSYRQEIKYDIQKMAEDKVPMKDALDYITNIGSVGDKKFAANYYKALTEQSYLSIPTNKFRYGAIAFGATTDEARAKVLYASFPNFNVIENDEVMRDLKLMGIATPMTMMYYKEIYANKGVLKSRL